MKRTFVAFSICAAMAFVGCIDRDFELSEVSGEVTVGGEELVLPLGELNKIKLSDLLDENDKLGSNEEGVYQVRFSSFGDDPTKYEKLSVEGISIPTITGLSPKLNPLEFTFQQMPKNLNLRGISRKFDINLPDIGQIVKVAPINISQVLDLGLPTILKGQGTLPEYLVPTTPFSCSHSDEVVFNASLSILEQLNKVDWVEFGCSEHPFGAPFTINIDMNGLQDINGGGTIDLKVEFPHGYYLRDENGNDFPTATHNILTKRLSLDKKQKSVSILVYLHRIDYSDHAFNDGLLVIEDHIKYSYDLSFNLCNGNYNIDAMPTFSLSAAPEYKDVEIVINHFDIPTLSEPLSYSFNGLPSAIDVERIAFTEDTEIVINLNGLEWFSAMDNLTNEPISPYIEIGLPKCMHFRKNELLDTTTNTLIASTADLAKGVRLSLEYIDCKAETIKQELGQLTINENITASVHLEVLDGHTVLASALTPPHDLNVTVSIAESTLTIDTANTKVTWNEDKSFNFDFEDQIPTLSQSIDIPEMISSIERIEIGKANSKDEPLSMTFSFGAMEGSKFPVNELEAEVAVNLGKLLHPTADMISSKLIQQNENGDYILSIKESWKPNEARLVKTIKFDALENIPAVVDGKVTLNQSFPVTGSVKIKSGENIDLAAASDAKIDVDIKIDDIEVRKFTGGVNIEVAPDEMAVSLGELGNLGLDINSLKINPILNVKLKDNPTGIPFKANLSIKGYDNEGKLLQTINTPTITIAGTGASNIILSTPRNAAKYGAVEGVTFVAVEELANILSSGIPSKITVNMVVASDKEQTYTIDLARAALGYDLEYQYEVVIPFEFEGNVDIAYEDAITDLNETFVNIADETKGLKVGDVGLVAEFGTNIPFNIVVSAWLINAEGTTENIEAKLNINNCLIQGHNPANGEKSISVIDLDFDLGESKSLAGLKSADGVMFKFSLYDADNTEAKLSKDQFIEGKLKLRIRDGLTVDIFDFLNNEEK